jgi:MFS family permease
VDASRALRARAREWSVRTWRVAAIAGFTGVLFGYDISSTNDAIAFMEKRFGLDSLDQGLVVSALLLGALAGALGAGKLADTWGRRPSVILAGLAAAIGALAAAAAPDLAARRNGCPCAFASSTGCAIGSAPTSPG